MTNKCIKKFTFFLSIYIFWASSSRNEPNKLSEYVIKKSILLWNALYSVGQTQPFHSYWVYETEPYCEDQFKDWFEFNIFIELEDQIKK